MAGVIKGVGDVKAFDPILVVIDEAIAINGKTKTTNANKPIGK